MRINSIFSACVCALLAALSCSKRQDVQEEGFLEALQPRDSVLIGDQLVYGFNLVSVPDGTEVIVQDWTEETVPGVMPLGGWRIDTLAVHRQDRKMPPARDLRGSILLTSFDEGLYELPAVEVLLRHSDGVTDRREFEGRFLDVTAMPVDTASFEVHEIKDQIRYPVTFREVFPWVAASVMLATLIAGLIVLIVVLVHRRRRKTEGPKEPAHITALRRLDALRGPDNWTPQHQKATYSALTEALREYIADRYEFPAMEMTSREIMDGLSSCEMLPELYAGLERLFSTADYVKFAKHTAPEEENVAAVPLAVRFVTETYRRELDADAAGGADDENGGKK